MVMGNKRAAAYTLLFNIPCNSNPISTTVIAPMALSHKKLMSGKKMKGGYLLLKKKIVPQKLVISAA
jgi:hypothetical protein